jgi:Cu(I)/Ag(I) efflux system membrane fusion protein
MFVTGTVKSKLNTYRNHLVVPRSAVLWTGPRSIVYVKQPGADEPVFAMREVRLGPMLGNSYVITDGLAEGEEIVTQGAFSVDATAQLEGKPSMMNSGEIMTQHETTVTEFLGVSGSCEMCKDRIEHASLSLDGVVQATWDSKTQKLRVTFDTSRIGLDDLHKAIAGAGHDTEKMKADDAVYNALPECCLYRK